jgi:hypothetical protein
VTSWVLVAATTCRSSAWAASETPSTPLELTGPPSCIDAASFRRRLAALPASSQRADVPRSVSIQITENEGTFSGEVLVKHQDGSLTVRSVGSPRCDEVVEALELITALALGLEQPSVVAPATPPSVPPASSQRDVEATPVAASEPARWRFLVAGHLALLGGAGPNLELAPDLALGVFRDGGGVLSPSFELSGTYTSSGNISTSVGTTTLTLAAGAATVCPVRFEIGDAFALRPCVEVSVGALSGSAQGTGVLPTPTKVDPWVAVAPMVRAEWRLGSNFELRGEGGPAFHADGDRFFFDPSGASAYSVPAAGGLVAKVGLAVLFP